MSTKIYVGGLSRDVAEEDVHKLFSTYGTVLSVELHNDSKTDSVSQFAYISIEDAQGAQKAMTVLNGKDFMGQKMRVNQARIMQDTGARGMGTVSF